MGIIKDIQKTLKSDDGQDAQNTVSEDDKKEVKSSLKAGKTRASKKNNEVKLKEDTGNAYRIIKYPIFTEQSQVLAALGKYVFRVSMDASKTDVAYAVAKVYDKKVAKVNMIRMQGKKVMNARWKGKKKDWKKAIITLNPGETMEVNQ
ncbi:MAG: 50S ribosomal protein L23 [Parcubacteria group bacterium]|nr:50S ribosomal protein L23 [Parcubacteria group bacterium]